MAKKKKSTQLSWCWYCDRTFEDDKVLLQHQKAKHFRCPHCPRRLNTAGGLGVHIDQVHKLGTDKIENALPGRESFDVEIYGMEGIPPADLAAWKKRTAETSGAPVHQNQSKKAKYSTAPISASDMAAQLAAHRALMSGLPLAGAGAGYGVPPPGFGAPPGFALPQAGFVPPPFLGAPNPFPFPFPPGIPPPPGYPGNLAFPPPPGAPNPFPVLPIGLPFPPPGMVAFPPAPAGFVPPSFPSAPLPFPPPPAVNLAVAPGTPSGPAAMRAQAQAVVEKVESSSVVLKEGTLLVYGDADVSPEEKRAKLAQYKVEPETEEEEASKKRARATDFLET